MSPPFASRGQTLPILLNLLAAVFGAAGQYLFKLGGLRLGATSLFRNGPIYAGMAMFCLVMVLFVSAYRLGGRLSVVYPAYATTFVWGMLFAIGLDHEPWSAVQFCGIAAILLGVYLVAAGSPQ